MFSEILEDGVRWSDGTVLRADGILSCTGFRGRLATQAAKNTRVHLVGYSPSASTIGTNRAGAAAAKELMVLHGEEKR